MTRDFATDLAAAASLLPDKDRFLAALYRPPERRRLADYRAALGSPFGLLMAPPRVVAGGGKVLNRLDFVSEALITSYPWAKWDAVLFLVNGEPPPVTPIRVTQIRAGRRQAAAVRVVLEVDPTTDPAVIDQWYRDIRSGLRPQRHRPLSEKHLALITFWTEDKRAHPKATWAESMARWNERCPTWERLNDDQDWRMTNYRQYQRDVVEARKKLMRAPADADTNTYGQDPDHG